MRRAVVAIILAASLARSTQAAETCRFEGKTDYNGRLAIVAETRQAGDSVRVDIRLALDAEPFVLWRTHYRMQEISIWGPDGLRRLGVNSRYSVGSHIVRQQWDVFDRAPDGLDAHRIEGKTGAGFRRDHPAFIAHWDPRTFGQAWLEDFAHAAPERRPDLDLRQMSPGVRPPLALAFYWVRRLPPAGGVIPVFLAGFKDQKRVDLPIEAPQAVAGADRDRPTWLTPLRYPELSSTRPSIARAWLSRERRVLRLAFDLHGVQYSARGSVMAQGCTVDDPASP